MPSRVATTRLTSRRIIPDADRTVRELEKQRSRAISTQQQSVFVEEQL